MKNVKPGPCKEGCTCGKHTASRRGKCAPDCTCGVHRGAPKRGTVLCSATGCVKMNDCARGYCPEHYERWRRHGDPNFYILERNVSADYYLNKRIKKNRRGCWVWQATLRKGYGEAAHAGKLYYNGAHRLAYETWVGPIPKGLVIHHKCSNRACINPKHLQAVTPTENTAEMFERQTMLKEIRELKKRIRDLEADAA